MNFSLLFVPALASEPAAGGSGIEGFPLLMGLLGGLALFLYGMDLMAQALKAVAGDRMRAILARLTTNRFMGVVTGAFVTAVIQSSSVTTVLVVGFVSAGLMTLTQSVGVIMGANIGTTVTAQIIAFKVTKFALLMIALGFATSFLAKKGRNRNIGSGLLGIGLMFFGMGVMSDSMSPLRDFPPFLEWMTHLESPWVGILAGAVFTALVQASAATTGVVIVLATQGLITLPAGIAISLGANIGTCVTALLATLGKPREALRAAMVHIVFNVVGVVLWVVFIDQLAGFVTWLSPAADDLEGTARLAAETPRQIANAHTVFNVSNTLIFVWFTGQLARLVKILVPDVPVDESRIVRARYLDAELLSTPTLAIDRARLELLRLGDQVRDMLQRILPALLSGTRDDLAAVRQMDDTVDRLHGEIIAYLGRVSQQALTDKNRDDLLRLMSATNDLECIGDIIETNLVTVGHRRLDEQVLISNSTRDVIQQFHRTVSRALDHSIQAVTQKNEAAAVEVLNMKKEIYRLEGSAAMHQAKRLVAAEPNRLPAYAVEMDILANLKRVYHFCKRLARGEVSADAAVKAS